MLDGRYAATMNRLWDFLGRQLARTGISPNAVTLIGLALVAAAAAAYLFHRNDLVFGACLAVAFAFDGLDGAVARVTGRTSRFGGYLDAVIDRYQEIIALAAIAWVHDLWPAAFLVITGSFLTSYNKARVALEMPVGNLEWPDLIERFERIVILVAILVFGVVAPGLIVLGVLAHATAVQRFLRARRRLLDPR
jgi:archaetidylinositol phosphate synthase